VGDHADGAVHPFFEHYDLAGKVLVPFCTHEGSYLGRSVTDMQALAPRATILDGLAVRGKASKADPQATMLRTGWLT